MSMEPNRFDEEFSKYLNLLEQRIRSLENETTRSSAVETTNRILVTQGGSSSGGNTEEGEGAVEWQEPVEDKDVSDPTTLTPSDGDRYIVASGGTGDWNGKDDDIAEYDGSSWLFTTPTEGYGVYIKDENKVYVYTTSWVTLDSLISHDALTNFAANEHFTEASIALANIDSGSPVVTDLSDVDQSLATTDNVQFDFVAIDAALKNWHSNFRGIQGNGISIIANNSANQGFILFNAFYDATDVRWEYVEDGYAARIWVDDDAGELNFDLATSGTANTAITWTNVLKFDTGFDMIYPSPPTATGTNLLHDASNQVALDSSTSKFKENIATAVFDINKLAQLEAKRWDIRDNKDIFNKKYMGISFIAEDIEALFPELCNYRYKTKIVKGEKEFIDELELISYNVKGLQAYMLEWMKLQQNQIDDLRSRVEQLELS